MGWPAEVEALGWRPRRETEKLLAPQEDRIVVGDVMLDRGTQQVWRRGKLIEMPEREFDLLRVLMEHAGRAVKRRELLDPVRGEGWVGFPRKLNVHVRRLRQKSEDEP